MPVACLCGLGPKELTGIGGHTPAITADQIRQIGIRSVDEGEKRLVKDHGLDVYDMRYIDEVGMKRAMEAALDGVDADTHLHVSFDAGFTRLPFPWTRRNAALAGAVPRGSSPTRRLR